MSTKKLTDCPSNLKEAIDWILRVTGKDGGGSKSGTTELAAAVKELLDGVDDFGSNIKKEEFDKVKNALGDGSSGLIKSLAEGLQQFIGYEADGGKPNGKGIALKSYASSYPSAAKWESMNSQDDKTKCAKIFLGCLPLYYQALTYMYWRCHKNGGGWKDQTLAHGALKSYFDSQGLFSAYVDTNKRGAHIAESAFQKFSEFVKGMSGVSSSSTFTYASFTEKLLGLVNSGDNLTSNCPLSALFYGASYYFRYQQTTNAKSAVSAPKTIREMLYFLAAMPFSLAYDEINGHIDTAVPNDLSVADSSDRNSNNTLSATQLKEYLRASCSLSSCVLGLIQGPGASEHNSEPWLFELFCNSAFHFKYPSGPTIFSNVSNYAYALQFQLYFLYSMCANNVNKCGWQDCTYGRNVNASGASAFQSHICQGLKCNGDTSCKHDGTHNGCNHNKYDDTNGCGKSATTPSPLQAFLTDGIQGMCRQHPGSSYHLATCSGPMCHTPMGFEGTHLRQNPGTGNYILSALRPICGDVSSPFRHLCEKLGCLTKRTPRTLGELFGFMWYLNGQLFNTSALESKLHDAIQNSTTQTLSTFLKSLNVLQPPSLFSNSLNKLAEVSFWNTPDSYGLASLLATNFFSLNQHCHKKESSGKIIHSASTNGQGCTTSPNDLWSLCQPVKAKPTGVGSDTHAACRGKDCGPYLFPLTHSAGATYAPDHASVYLSWLAYLTDDLQSGFQEFLDEFKNIDCSQTGCRTSSSNTKCDKAHSPGTHGSNQSCKCNSVVHCGGVLPVLYRHGFQFHSPYTLSGGNDGSGETKRDCQKFNSALSNVLAEGAPLAKLLETIDSFLYLFRFYFFYNQSTFWTIYVCIILYTFFFLLDTLRIRSHLHFPSSNSIAPVSLISTGKAPALKKFAKLTYFFP
ncbi:variant erythrocyte surface antigen-1 family protein [Babesia caballi]|uniref:Variant erythrocyte surface antigen-1 family protein n=1 Tax=Babesia caballi TaxID=5871 RepID=A0AAV4LUF8_BABCB|nr:variant erythrocyte surface antigen-1 family protein [Babesia caballi]